MARVRLHKFLAGAGVASRRASEELIEAGRVSVDGITVTRLGTVVDPEIQDIRFDGERVTSEPPVYYLVNKPSGYLCTNVDEYGRRTVVSLVKDRQQRRLFTVGRLDEDSEGIIVVTNDGSFANRISHPRYGVEKTYHLRLRGSLENDSLRKTREGVWLADGKTLPMYVKLFRRTAHFTSVQVKVREGRNRQLRRIFAKVGHPVVSLLRVRIGPIGLDGLKRGAYRRLRPDEVKALLTECRDGTGNNPVPAATTETSDSRGSGRRNDVSSGRRERGGASNQRSRGGRRPTSSRGRSSSKPNVRRKAPSRGPRRRS